MKSKIALNLYRHEYYTLVDYSLGLSYLDTSAKYKWRIRKQVRGTWKDITKEPQKTGLSVSFKFGEAVIGEQFLIEVYKETKNIFTQKNETHKMGDILVVPKSSQEPKITKVVLFNRGARDINKASYMDTLIAQAHCVGLFNQEIEFHLWEDDAKGAGHHAEINKHNKSPKTYKARVNAKGIAEVKISLAAEEKVLRQIADRYMMKGDKNEGSHHEYYITASYSGKIRGASQVNVSVKNPDDKTSNSSTSKPKPESYTPKFPATPASRTPTQQDKEGKIKAAYFVNGKNQRLVKTAVGEHVKVQIITQGMVGKHLQYRVWEHDRGKHDLIYTSERIKIKGDIITTGGFTILKGHFEKGIDFGSLDPDATSQNYYLEVIPLDISANSKKFGVDSTMGLMEVESARSPSMVKEEKAEKKKDDAKCPRCEILTKEEVDKIFITASETNKKALLEAFNDGNLKFEINTCLRKAHFFAQVLEEVGASLKLSEPESFNYSARRLKDGDYVEGTGWVKDLVNGGHFTSGSWKSSPFSYFKTHHKEANLYGRKDLNKYNDNGIQAANSKEIANIVYADKNREPKYRLGNTQVGDGWKFLGKGIIQITGRANYTEVNKRLEKKGYNFDIVNNPDNVLKHKESVLSSMAFWYWKDLQIKSDKGGKDIVDSITKIVNEGTSTYSERRGNFDKTYSVFQVDKCLSVKKREDSKSNGKWRMPIDNPMLCLYSQGGGEKPWHGSFGEKIRDSSENHAGVDLLAKPGLPVYACLKGKVDRVYTSTSRAGRVVVIKVTDKETFKSLKRNYTPLYKDKGEILGKGFDPDGDIFLVFMHLSEFGKFQEGQSVNHDDIIGYTGISGKNGNNFETRNPHLHFEVNNVGSVAGLNGKCNPMVYFKFKTESEMSVEDKKLQLEYKNKVWK